MAESNGSQDQDYSSMVEVLSLMKTKTRFAREVAIAIVYNGISHLR